MSISQSNGLRTIGHYRRSLASRLPPEWERPAALGEKTRVARVAGERTPAGWSGRGRLSRVVCHPREKPARTTPAADDAAGSGPHSSRPSSRTGPSQGEGHPPNCLAIRLAET